MPPNAFLIRWSGGWHERTDPVSLAAHERWEAALGLGTIQSLTEVNAEADGELARFAHPRFQASPSFDPRDATEIPYSSGWRPGHVVTGPAGFDGAAGQIRTLSMAMRGRGSDRPLFDPVFGDEILTPEVAAAQAQKKMINGTLRGASRLATPVSQVRTIPALVILREPEPISFGDQIAYWPFNDGSGDPVDAVNGFDLTAHNGSAEDPGSTDWLSDPDFGTVADATTRSWTAAVRVPQSGYTITTWNKADSVPIVGATPGPADYNVAGVMLNSAGTGDLSALHTANAITTAANVILTNVWQFYALTWDGVTVRFYVGTLGGLFQQVAEMTNDATEAGPGVAIGFSYSHVNMHGGPDHVDRRWPGRQGPCGWWDGPVSESELAARFANRL